MNRTDATYKKIKYIGDNLNVNKKNSKISYCKVNLLLKQKQKKQNIITQIEATIKNLEELKTREIMIHINEKKKIL